MSEEEFGKWKTFHADEVHRGDAYGAPKGLLLLETQQSVSAFLPKMIAVILGNAGNTDTPARQKKTSISSSLVSGKIDQFPVQRDWLQYFESKQCQRLSKFSFGSTHAEQCPARIQSRSHH